MRRITAAGLVTALTGLVIAAYVPYHVNATYPLVGLDYKYFISRLLDTSVYYRLNGLGIQWYSPSFGGGLPVYPHPLDEQFSLPQLLGMLFSPWTAMLASYFVYVLAGYAAAYLFLRRSLALRWSAATLGAAIFSANGFYLEHMAAGHLNFQGYPLLPVYLAALLSVDLPVPAAAAIIGLTSGVIIYSGSSYPALYIILALLVCLPMAYLIRPQAFRWRRFWTILLLGGLLSLTLVVSKLYAVNSFMRFFPRVMPDTYDLPLWLAPFGLLLQFAGVMGMAPLVAALGLKMGVIRELLQVYTGSGLGLWELDLSISPLTWLLLAGGLVSLARAAWRRGWEIIPRRRGFWLGLAALLLALEITLEFTFGRGLLYPIIRQLPLLRAMHINPRFGASLIMPLALAAAGVFHYWVRGWTEKRTWYVFAPLLGLVLLSLAAYQLLPLAVVQPRSFNLSGLEAVAQRVSQGETFPISLVGDVTDQTAFERGTTSLHPFDSLFGYNQQFFTPDLVKGPADMVRGNAYNMTDPSGLVYPEANGSSLWSRIPLSQQAELMAFLAHKHTDWKLPAGQVAANWISLLSLAANLGLLGFGLRRAWSVGK